MVTDEVDVCLPVPIELLEPVDALSALEKQVLSEIIEMQKKHAILLNLPK